MCSSSFSSPLEETHFSILEASSRCMLVSCGSMLFLIESFLEIKACILWLNVIPYSNFTFIFANSISYITKSTPTKQWSLVNQGYRWTTPYTHGVIWLLKMICMSFAICKFVVHAFNWFASIFFLTETKYKEKGKDQPIKPLLRKWIARGNAKDQLKTVNLHCFSLTWHISDSHHCLEVFNVALLLTVRGKLAFPTDRSKPSHQRRSSLAQRSQSTVTCTYKWVI